MRSPSRWLLAIPVLASLTLGCNFAELKGAPDASPTCLAPQLEYPCQMQEAGTPGCSGDLQSTRVFARDVLIDAGTYPVSCTVIVNATITDQNNQCTTLGTCHCTEDASTFAWDCIASH